MTRQPRVPLYIPFLKKLVLQPISTIFAAKTGREQAQMSPLNNPFVTSPFPPQNIDQLPMIISCMTLQIAELEFRNLSLMHLSNFVLSNSSQLIDLLSEKGQTCECFCYCLLRYLQEATRSADSALAVKFGDLDAFAQLLSSVYERKVNKIINESSSFYLNNQGKERQKQSRMLFHAYAVVTSMQFMQHDRDSGQNYVSRAMQTCCLIVHLAENQIQFALVRDILAVTSHLFIFNGVQYRPKFLLDFCFGVSQEMQEREAVFRQQIDNRLQSKYVQSLCSYLKLDPDYQTELLEMLRTLLQVKVKSSTMIINHFQAVVLVIRERILPQLKKNLYLLLETQNGEVSLIVDQVFFQLINFEAQLLEENTQRFNVSLAQKGGSKRKQTYLLAYYAQYRRGKLLLPVTINQIFRVFITLQISLSDFNMFVANEANKFDSTSILQLHSELKENASSQNCQILSIILQSRKKDAFNSTQENNEMPVYEEPAPFIQEDWLTVAGGSTKVFRVYIKIIVDTVCTVSDKPLQINPPLININQSIVKIQSKHYDRALYYYKVLLRVSARESHYHEPTFRQMILGQAIFCKDMPIDSLDYFHQHFSYVSAHSEFLTFLQYVVTLFKNKMAILLYLQALIVFQKTDSQSFYRRKLYELSFLSRLMDINLFFRLNTYCIQAVALLFELSIVINDYNTSQGKKFKECIIDLLKGWSGLMSKADCKNICYFFCFRQVKKIYPFVEQKQIKDPRERMTFNWRVINELLQKKIQPKQYYYAAANTLLIEWRDDERSKISLQIEGTFIRNINMELFWQISITTTSKLYQLTVNNDRLINTSHPIAGKSKNDRDLKEYSIKELKKNPQLVKFSLRADSISKNKVTIVLMLMDKNVEIPQLEGSIQSIQLNCKSTAFLYDIAVSDHISQTEKVSTQFHKHITWLNQWQIIFTRLSRINQTKFSDKFDFQHAFCQLEQMLHHFQKYNIGDVYQLFFQLAQSMIQCETYDKVIWLSPQVKTMNTVFKLIRGVLCKQSHKIGAFSPQIRIFPVKQYLTGYFHLFCSALFPVSFWCNFSLTSKKQFVQIFLQCFEEQPFRKLQNSTMQMFETICELISDEEIPEVIKLLNSIILRHQLNQQRKRLVGLKFQHYLIKAQKGSARQYFNTLLVQLTKYLNVYPHFLKEREMGIFLITESVSLQIIFELCPVEVKINILHYFSHHSNSNLGRSAQINKIKKLLELLKPEEGDPVMLWLITEVKQVISLSKDKFAQDANRIINIYLLIILQNLKFVSLESKQIVLSVIVQILTWTPLRSANSQIESLLVSQQYIGFLQEIIEHMEATAPYCCEMRTNIFTLSMDFIVRFNKNNLLQFMINFRRQAGFSCSLLTFPLNYQGFKTFGLFGTSILLQYTYEVLIFSLEHSNFTQEQRCILIEACHKIVKFEIDNLQQHSSMQYPLVYNYPKLMGERQCPFSHNKMVAKVQAIQKCNTLQMRGGIYFKMVAILLTLINTPLKKQYHDYSQQLGYLVRGIYKKKSKKRSSIFMAYYRSPLDYLFQTSAEAHKKYFLQEDLPLNHIDEQNDLSFYLTDYILMRIAQFLQQKHNLVDATLFKQYSDILTQALEDYPIMAKQINQAYALSDYQLPNYSMIFELSSKILFINCNSLNFHPSETQPQRTTKQLNIAENNSSKIFNTPQKMKRPVDLVLRSGSKGNDILKLEKARWMECANHFSNQSKQIRYLQLLHVHFVLSWTNRQSKASNSKSQQLEALAKRHSNLIKEEHQLYLGRYMSIEQNKKIVKKIYPYTSPRTTVLRISGFCLPNMACPVTYRVTVKDYHTKRFRHLQSINQHYFQNFEVQINAFENQLQQQRLNKKDKSNSFSEIRQKIQSASQEEVLNTGTQYCEWVTREGVYFCQWEFREGALFLRSIDQRPSPKSQMVYSKIQKKLDPHWYLLLGTPSENILRKNGKQLFIYFSQIQEIFYRKFNQIFSNSLQFFLNNGKSRFISFYTKRLQDIFVKQLQKRYRDVKWIRDPAKQFERSNYADKWIEGQISNFDYLMLLNKFSSRSYNDLNQYYVFPWVLQDYSSSKLDLSDPQSFRDLSKPVGAINPLKLQRYLNKYKSQTFQQRCLYGSHYSTSLFVYYYMVRLEPYSSLHRQMQKGQFDVADRLFSSIEQVWANLVNESATSDIKEAIPEFYYMPGFLRNLGLIELGQKQCGEQVGEVKLPQWASSAEEFVITMRSALESDYVSENLHLWIDLIFGKHQNSEQRNNVFHPYCYTDPKDFEQLAKANMTQLEGIICQISYFGQCPLQLFKKDHKPKKIKLQRRSSKNNVRLSLHQLGSTVSSSQVMLPDDWKLIYLSVEGNYFYLEVQNSKRAKQVLVISAFADFQTPKNIFSFGLLPKKVEGHIFHSKLQKNRSVLRMDRQFIMDLNIDFQYSRVETNDMWIAFFGLKGLRIYSWQLQLFWSWELDEVRGLYLESTRLIFFVPSGKVGFYSFFDGKLDFIRAYQNSYDMQVKVVSLHRLHSLQYKNQNTYKVLCVGDGRRATMINYTFEEVFNRTSVLCSQF